MFRTLISITSQTPEVMKRARRSLYEACAAARSKEAAERAYLGLQPLRQLHQQQQHDLYLLEQMKQEQQHPQLLLVEDWINGNDVVQSESDCELTPMPNTYHYRHTRSLFYGMS